MSDHRPVSEERPVRRPRQTGTPRWVKLFALAAAALVALFLASHLLGLAPVSHQM